MSNKYIKYILILAPITILVNYLGKQLTAVLDLPLYFDMIGTIFMGAVAGPLPAMIVALISEMIQGITSTTWFFFAIVHIVCGVVAGVAGKKGAFTSWWKTLLTAFILWAVVLLLTVPIVTLLFADDFIASSLNMLWTSLSTRVVIYETLDKIITTFLVYSLLKVLPGKLLMEFPFGSKY